MIRRKGAKRKTSLMTFLSLCSLILGVCCVSLALFNIGIPIAEAMNASEPLSVESRQNNMIPNLLDAVSLNIDSPRVKNLPEKKPTIYPKSFKEGDKIGRLEIPVLKRKLTLIEGTSKASLKKGVGHFTQSVMPGISDNCVISGHRDTVFKGIGKLKIGDILILETSEGSFTYAISETKIVHRDDKTVIVPTDHAVLTLTTCYPFNFIGNAPDRYIISADLVQ